MGIPDLATFDIRAYIRDKPFESHGLRWHSLNPKWAEDPVWLCYLINKVETAQAYHRAFYAAAKEAARKNGLDCAVFRQHDPPAAGRHAVAGRLRYRAFRVEQCTRLVGSAADGSAPGGPCRPCHATGCRHVRRTVLLAEHLRDQGAIRRGARAVAQGARLRLPCQSRAARFRPRLSRWLLAGHGVECRIREPLCAASTPHVSVSVTTWPMWRSSIRPGRRSHPVPCSIR